MFQVDFNIIISCGYLMNSLDQCMERFERQVADQKCDQGANDNTDDPGLDQKRNL